jgi:PAS domain S-box-containing protein
MLTEEPELRSFFEHYKERVTKIYKNRALQQAADAERERSAEVIRENEEKLRLLVDGAKDYAMIMLDTQGRITSWNLGAERLLGYTEADVLGSPINIIFTPEDREAKVPEAEISKAADQGKAMDKRWHVKKDGNRMWADGLMEALCDEKRELKGFAKILRDSTAEKIAADILKGVQASLLERERNIASQLQAALQPDLPDSADGLEMARVYEAALGEAAVGGDFYDVFSAHDRTMLVLGDMSGKGLAAASQVATIRNMLRAYLYSKPGIASGINDLNRTICTNGLLSGFATLFVGCYDASTSTMSYINCGQEPGLVRKANSSDILLLEPNGPVIGLIPDAEYTEHSVTFEPGDALAIFSDGLTDVGPNRRDLLGVEGVSALFSAPLPQDALESPAKLAHTLADMLMAGVDAADGGVRRDDVCLLVAVVA